MRALRRDPRVWGRGGRSRVRVRGAGCDGADRRLAFRRRHGVHPRGGGPAGRVPGWAPFADAQGRRGGERERVRDRGVGAAADEPARGRDVDAPERGRPRDHGRGRSHPGVRGQPGQRGGVGGAPRRVRCGERPGCAAGHSGRPALLTARGLGGGRGGAAGPSARVSVRASDRGREAGRRRRDPAGDGDGRLALGHARGRAGTDALPADGRRDAARQQRRADARRGRLRGGRREDEAVAGCHEHRRWLHGAREPGQGLPGCERSSGATAVGAPATGRAPPARLEAARRGPAGRHTPTARPRACSRMRATSGEIGFRVDRWETPWPASGLEEALLGGEAVRGFVPARPGRVRGSLAIASAGRDARRGPDGEPDRFGHGVGRAGRPLPSRVRDRGPRTREGGGALPGARGRARLQPRPPPSVAAELRGCAAGARSSAALPGCGRGSRAGAGGLPERGRRSRGAARVAARAHDPGRLRDAAGERTPGLLARHPTDYTIVLRALRWSGSDPRLARGSRDAATRRVRGHRGLRRFASIGWELPSPSAKAPCGAAARACCSSSRRRSRSSTRSRGSTRTGCASSPARIPGRAARTGDFGRESPVRAPRGIL